MAESEVLSLRLPKPVHARLVLLAREQGMPTATPAFTVFTHPVVLGSGRPLFDDHDEPVELDLLEHASFDEGVTMHRYAVRGARPIAQRTGRL